MLNNKALKMMRKKINDDDGIRYLEKRNSKIKYEGNENKIKKININITIVFNKL